MFDDVPSNYQTMTQTLYDYNETIYSLEGIGILFIVLRSSRIFNILLQHLLPFKLIVLFKPKTLNLYYFCGLVLVNYLRFGTSGTQIPYTENDSTNGKYYYFLGTNSDAAVENQYYLNGNYTSQLLHDCDFTLFLLLLLGLICLPYLFMQWPKIIKQIIIIFIEGSIFELTLGSVGQIAQNIYNQSTSPLDIIFSIIGGFLLIFNVFIAIRPILAIKFNSKYFNLNFYANQMLENKKVLFLCLYSLNLFNELLMGILPTIIGNFSIIFYIQIGVCGTSILLSGLQFTQSKVINSIIILMNGLLITSYVLITFDYYQYGFIIMILLSCHFLFGLSLQVLQIVQLKHQTEELQLTKQPLQVTVELQSISLQLEQSHQQPIPTVPHSKFMLTSQISNIMIFNSHSYNTSTEIVKEEQLIVEKQIQKQQCLQFSQFFDSGFVKLNKLVCQFKFQVKVFNKIHEIDPKILKRNNIGNKVKGIHSLILRASEDCEIEELQLKTYFSDQLLQRDIKIVNKHLQSGQQLELNHEHLFEQNESWSERLTVKITMESKSQRFSLCNSEIKLFQVMPLPFKSLQKIIDNGPSKLVVLHEQRLERFNIEKVTEYCKHYGLYNHKLESAEAEYRNQELLSRWGKVSLILPGTPYIRLILSIEQQVNRDNTHPYIEPNIDLQRIQYVMVSVFAKKSSNQLTYAHKRICEYFGQQLINYFNQ